MRLASVPAYLQRTEVADGRPEAETEGELAAGESHSSRGPSPVRHRTVTTLTLVAPLRTRRHRTGLAATVAAAMALLAACETGSGPASADDPAATTTEPARTVPEVTAGALRAEVQPPRDPRPGATEHEVLLYGDSVAVLIADDLAAEVDAPLVVDGMDCRRLDRRFTGPCGGVPDGVEVPSGLADLGPAVRMLDDPAGAVAVVVIANNAALQPEDLDAAMAELAPVRRVWWVTARVDGRGWQDPNNRRIAELAQRDPRAGVIDWFAASEDRGWLRDNVHPGDEGQAAFAELVAAHLRCDCTP